jgi:isopenicillin-N epimerase
MLGSIAALPLPDATEPPGPFGLDSLQEQLFHEGFEVPVMFWPAWPRRLLRVAAQAYNAPAQYEQLAASVAERLGKAPAGMRGRA